MHIVIIGAGPIGLYLGYQLKKAGIHQFVLYDPRAGEYIRPGHLIKETFERLATRLGKDRSKSRRGHIKDLERILFEEHKNLGTTIEKKEFISFSKRPKGIIVLNSLGKKELIACDFVFDCTGQKRVLAHHLNSLINPPPFTLRPISTEVRIKNQMLAYIGIDEASLIPLNKAPYKLSKNIPADLSQLPQYTQGIRQLHQLGWAEWGLPRIFKVNHKKGKICLYTECPDYLPKESYDSWIKACIYNITGDSTIQFHHLPPPRKYKRKPRLIVFRVDPFQVPETACIHKQFPTVILMGDSQIDPNYWLAHGITNGLKRVDAFISTLKIHNETIVSFNPEMYQKSIQLNIERHKEHIVSYNQERIHYFEAMLYKAQEEYKSRLDEGKDQTEEIKQYLREGLKEVQACLDYQKACADLAGRINEVGGIKLTEPLEDQSAQLITLGAQFIKVIEEMPPSFKAQKDLAIEQAKIIAQGLKGIAKKWIKKNDHNKAFSNYQEALRLYQAPALKAQDSAEALNLEVEFIICHRKLKQHQKAIELGSERLKSLTSFPLQKKVLFNVLKSIRDSVFALDNTPEQVEALQERGLELIQQYPNVLQIDVQEDFEAQFTPFRPLSPSVRGYSTTRKTSYGSRSNTPRFFMNGTPSLEINEESESPLAVFRPLSP
jgi:hypothetical protein